MRRKIGKALDITCQLQLPHTKQLNSPFVPLSYSLGERVMPASPAMVVCSRTQENLLDRLFGNVYRGEDKEEGLDKAE